MKCFQFVCYYCGFTWEKTFYYTPDPSEIKCDKCGDKGPKMRPYVKVDYYK